MSHKLDKEFLRNIKRDLAEFPCYKVVNGKLVRIPTPAQWMWVHLHHYIRTGWIKRNPEKWLQVKHLQKLIYLEPVMHTELHSKHSKFKEKYGIEIKELLFDWRDYMLSAAAARKKSEENSIKNNIERVEKIIKKRVEDGQTDAFICGQLEKEVLDELEKAGFTWEQVQGGIKIFW